ncbi:unnamed protein product [Amoebophrya sp. A25]|nr:unnamed protein product [Amoebophrya sp. A25]|eukprot:GSA25T00007943001.1
MVQVDLVFIIRLVDISRSVQRKMDAATTSWWSRDAVAMKMKMRRLHLLFLVFLGLFSSTPVGVLGVKNLFVKRSGETTSSSTHRRTSRRATAARATSKENKIFEDTVIPFFEGQNLRSFIGLTHREPQECTCACCILNREGANAASNSASHNKQLCQPLFFGQTTATHSALDCEALAAGVPGSEQCRIGDGAVFFAKDQLVDKVHFCANNCEPAPMFFHHDNKALLTTTSSKGRKDKKENIFAMQQENLERRPRPSGPECVRVSAKTLDRLGLDVVHGAETTGLRLEMVSCETYHVQLFGGNKDDKNCAFSVFDLAKPADPQCTQDTVCALTGRMLEKLYPTFNDMTDCACQLCKRAYNWYAHHGKNVCANGKSVVSACRPCMEPLAASGCDAFRLPHIEQAVAQINTRDKTELASQDVDQCVVDTYGKKTAEEADNTQMKEAYTGGIALLNRRMNGKCTPSLATEIAYLTLPELEKQFDGNEECGCHLCVKYGPGIWSGSALAEKCQACVKVPAATRRLQCKDFQTEKFTAASGNWENLQAGELQTCVLTAFDRRPHHLLMGGLCNGAFICDALKHVSEALGEITGETGECACFTCLEMRKYLAISGQSCQHSLEIQSVCQRCVAEQDRIAIVE